MIGCNKHIFIYLQYLALLFLSHYNSLLLYNISKSIPLSSHWRFGFWWGRTIFVLSRSYALWQMVSWLDTPLRERQSPLSSSTPYNMADGAWGNQGTPVMTGMDEESRHFTHCKKTSCSARPGGTWLVYKRTWIWTCLDIKIENLSCGEKQTISTLHNSTEAH